MNALREIKTAQNGVISIVIPKKYKQKRFEVIVIPIDEKNDSDILKNKMAAYLESLPISEPMVEDSVIMTEIKAIRQLRIVDFLERKL